MIDRFTDTIDDPAPRTSPSEDGTPTSDSSGGWYRRLASRPAISQVPLSLLDQAIVSGTSFVTTLLIGRICGAEELGIYSLAFTVIVLITNLQTAVFTTPYTIYGSRMSGRPRHEYAGSVLVHCLMLMAVCSFGLAIAAISLNASWLDREHTNVIWVLVGVLPLLLLREFVRRFAFAHLKITVVLTLDIVASAIQLLGLWLLALNQMMTIANVYVVMGTACAIAAGGTLTFLKNKIAIRRNNILPELKQSWVLGRWLAATRATALIQTYAVHWILAVAWGISATGVYAACMTLLLAANPFVIGIGNLLEPKASRAFAEGGVQQLRSFVWKATQLLGGVMGLYCLILFIAGGWLVSMLFQGNQFENQGYVVSVLSLTALVGAWETGPIHGLRVLERPDLSFRASLLSLFVTLAIAMFVVRPYGALGGACAVFAGETSAALTRWIVFSRLSKERLFD